MKVGSLVKLYHDRDSDRFWLGLVIELADWECGILWANDGEQTWEEIENLVEVKI